LSVFWVVTSTTTFFHWIPPRFSDFSTSDVCFIRSSKVPQAVWTRISTFTGARSSLRIVSPTARESRITNRIVYFPPLPRNTELDMASTEVISKQYVPLTCHGHSRPVTHLSFSGVVGSVGDDEYYLISACKG